MFAAHCGIVNEIWITPDLDEDPPHWYLFGGTIARDVGNDGAIIDSTWSNPYMWTGPWDSDGYVRINGQTTAYVGQELCYSGAYSGLLCGNVVTSTTEVWSFGGDLTAIFGLRTDQIAGQPAVGNGDNGGPGYAMEFTPTTINRYAVAIISAIPSGSPATCRGIPGNPADGGRKCSPTVWVTSVRAIGNNLGWHVPNA